MPSIFSTSVIPQGIQILPSVVDFPVTGTDGQQLVAADTNTIYVYDTSVPGWQAVATPGAAIAITGLLGEVTATGPGAVNATISNAAVTNAKLAAMADNTIKGNKSGAPASPSDLALSDVTEATSSVLTISNGTKAIVGSSNLTIQVLQSSALQSGYLSSADYSTFNNKVSSVGASAPIASSGGTTPSISISQSGVATDGYLSSTDWNTFNNKQVALVSGTNIKTVSGNSLLGSGDVGTIGIDYGGTGQTTANAAFNALVPAQTGNSGKYLQTDGTNTSWQTISTLPAYAQDKTLYSTASGAEWRTVGTGSSDSSYPAETIILGAAKPTSLSGTKNMLMSTTALNYLTTESSNIIFTNTWVPLSSAGSSNVVIGIDSTANYSGDNVVIGANTSTNGLSSVAIGRSATVWGRGIAIGRSANANGFNGGDIAIGPYANASGGYGSIAIGDTATTTGNYSTVLGHTATASSFTNVVAIGNAANSGANNQLIIGSGARGGTGDSNLIIGYQSGRQTAGLTGANNTVVGSSSFNNASLTTAYENTIIGQATATAVTIGYRNSIVGQNAALQLTTGSENTVLGYYAGTTNASSGITTGNQNVCVGSRAALGSSTDSNATAVGFQAAAATNAVGIGANCRESSSYGTSVGASCSTVSSTNTYTVRVGYAVGNTNNPFGLYVGPIGGARSVFVGALTNGTRLATAYTNNDDCIFLGYSAGSRSQSTSNELFIDNQDRTTYAGQQTNSLIYGKFNATVGSQRLTINGQVNLTQGEKHASLHGQVGTANVITATVNNYYIGVDTSAAAKTVNLPAAATAGAGFVLVIKDEGGLAGTNAITIDADGAELIDGAATQPINANYGSLNLMCSGSAWFIM